MTPLCCTQNSLIKCTLPGVHWLLYEQSRVKVQKALLSNPNSHACEHAQVDDEGMVELSHHTALTALDLSELALVTDEGLQHLSGAVTNLPCWDPSSSPVMPTYMLHLLRGLASAARALTGQRCAGLTGLRQLSLKGLEAITEEGLQHLVGHTRLSSLSLELCENLDGLQALTGKPAVRPYQPCLVSSQHSFTA